MGYYDNKIEDLMHEIRVYAEENDGEISEELDAILQRLIADKELSIDSMAIAYKSIETKIEMYKLQEKALNEARKVLVKDLENAKRCVALSLKGKKYISENCSVSYRRSSKLVVGDVDKIPEQYIVSKTTESVDMREVTKEIRSGKKIGDAYLQECINIEIK